MTVVWLLASSRPMVVVEANRGGGIQRENMTVQRNPPVNTCATPPRDGRDGSPVGVTNKPARQSCSLQKHM
ncbi:hypothetical protein T08_14468, partial [Trichinella sp. T8]